MIEKKVSREKSCAVIKIGGVQELVSEGEILEIPRIQGKEGSKFKVKDILLLVAPGKIKIGTPIVLGGEVVFKILEHGRGEKIEIRKLRAKSRYRRKIGHRQPITKVQVEKIKT